MKSEGMEAFDACVQGTAGCPKHGAGGRGMTGAQRGKRERKVREIGLFADGRPHKKHKGCG